MVQPVAIGIHPEKMFIEAMFVDEVCKVALVFIVALGSLALESVARDF